MEDKEKRSRTTSDRLNMTERPGTKKSVRRTSVDGERTAKTRVSKEYTAGESTQRSGEAQRRQNKPYLRQYRDRPRSLPLFLFTGFV